MKGTIYVVGGTQKTDAAQRPEWEHYRAARIVALDPETGATRVCVEYISPPEATAPADPSILFRAASVRDGIMYACTSTEICMYDIPSFRQIGYVSHPWLNDVHHVRPTVAGGFLIVNTGLDMAIELSRDGSVVRRWDLADPARAFEPQTDYRRLPTTKPHFAHPNYAFESDGQTWVTLFHQRAAVCLDDMTRRIRDIAAEGIHDGIVFEGGIHFTSVDGTIARVDQHTLAVTERYDLNEILNVGVPLGWCRGIELVDRDHVLVGFSRLRPTRFRENVGWVKWKLGARGWGLAPTRVVCINLRQRHLVWEHEVESAEMNAIYSLHYVPC